MNSPEFEWVVARYHCSPSTVFEKLKLQIESDVTARTMQLPNQRNRFRFVGNGGSFAVAVEGQGISGQAIKFRLALPAIEVAGPSDEKLFEATVTLGDDGECRLRVGIEELYLWQFRKRALESLFFNQPCSPSV
jgi:hypothetical protein